MARALFILFLSLPLAAATADLGVGSSSFVTPLVVDPGERFTVTYTVSSKGPDLAEHAKLTVTLIAGATLINVQSQFGPCAQQGNDVVCESPAPFGQSSAATTFTIEAPHDLSGRRELLTVRVSSDTPDPVSGNNVFSAFLAVRHLFVVDSDADDGATSLRGQFIAMNSSCGIAGCKIVFARDMVIELLSPLPTWTQCGSTIDGGDKRVEVRGTNAKHGSGLEIFGACGADFTTTTGMTLRRVTISNFPENGVGIITPEHEPGRVLSVQHTIEECTLSGNRYRGIATAASDAYVNIISNTISGNVASGIAFYSVGYGNLLKNHITLNGASGVFIANSDIGATSNQIDNNGQYGISTIGLAHLVNGGNIIRDNGAQAIDFNMDGPSRGGPLRPPVLTDAFYDPSTGRTVIRGHLIGNNERSPQGGTFRIAFAAADAPNANGTVDAQRILPARTTIIPSKDGAFDRPFEVSVAGDLRGQYITGYTSYALFTDLLDIDSTELGDAVVVH